MARGDNGGCEYRHFFSLKHVQGFQNRVRVYDVDLRVLLLDEGFDGMAAHDDNALFV